MANRFSCCYFVLSERRTYSGGGQLSESSDRVAMIKLGKQLENPYSVENMKKALESLRANGRTEAIEITPTHLYLRFKPKNEEELSILKRDSTLILYDYPLDHEIEVMGNFYRDPALPPDQPTYQYCAVKVDKVLPTEVEYELLSDLFIPDEDRDGEEAPVRLASLDFIDALVDESLRLTDNWEEVVGESHGETLVNGRGSRCWRPAGTIKVWDDTGVLITRRFIVGYDEKTTTDYSPCYMSGDNRPCPTYVTTSIPIYEETTTPEHWVGVQGVEVRARRWFTTHRGLANAEGRYSCNGTFRRDANYSIDWERHHFALQDGWLNGATYNGPKQRGNWDLNLNSGEQEYYATIFRAAFHYYYGDIKGLRRPPLNGTFKTQMKIRAYLQNSYKGQSWGRHKEERRFLGAQIKIYTYTRSVEDTYSTVIHELAHASHWNMWREADDFDDTEPIVKESWASGVEWELASIVYPTYSRGYSRLRYTGVVEDMIDGFKTRTSSGYWTEDDPWVSLVRSYPDSVSGYTIRQLEDALQSKKTWTDWKNNIINTYDNETESKLHDCFGHWNTK